VHLILRHKSPKTGKIEEKHLQSPPYVGSDAKTHVYTAILRASNNSYAVLIDGEEKKAGSLFADFEPSINPPETIPDPEDKKPEDWVDEARWVLRPAQHVCVPAGQCALVDEHWALVDGPHSRGPRLRGIGCQPAHTQNCCLLWSAALPCSIPDPAATKPEDWDEDAPM
jgi:hypothetical protein